MNYIRCIYVCVVLVAACVNAATDTNPEIPTIPLSGDEKQPVNKPTETTTKEENIDNELIPDKAKPTEETKTNVDSIPVPTQAPNTDDAPPTRDTPPVRGSGVTHRPPRPPTEDNPTLYHYIPVPGPPGMPGPTGTTGNPGYPGPQGPMGYAGPPGNNGNNGSPGPVGRPGLDGGKGDQGLTGLQGDPGTPGAPGAHGDHGDTGPLGDRGQMGPIGRTGSRGLLGPVGPKGTRGTSGKQGPPGMRGFPGSCDCTQSLVYQRAFSVARTTSLTATSGHMIITWNHEFSNVGGDFDMHTGIFNVTIPGDHVIGIIDYGPNDSEDSSGNSVVLTLAKGDAVWLLLYDGKEIYSSHYKFTTFSGFLLFPNFD